MKIITVSLALAALLAAAPPLPAEDYDHIVVAVVEEANGRWQGGLIHTDYLLRIEERLQGEAPERMAISLPGGTVGDETHLISLSVILEEGERYLLFLGGKGSLPAAIRAGDGFAGAVEAAREGLRPAHESFVLSGDLAVPPIVFSPLPAESPFSPYDQHQMAYWNVYQPDLFRVGPPTAAWDFGNGVFEIVFADSARVQPELGFEWPAGAPSAIAWRIQGGHIVEADIALNPGVAWTLDDDAATRPGGPHSFRRTVLSHLGKAWGLETPSPLRIVRESVVGIAPQEYRLPTLFSDDTAAVRAAFGGAPVRDGLISSYQARPANIFPNYLPSVPSPATVRPGQSFNLRRPIKIENPGTEDLAGTEVEVYLAPRRFSLEGAILLRRVRVRGTVPAGAVRELVVGRVQVPRTVPPGGYYLAFRLLAGGDEHPGNDVAWSNHDVKLKVKAR